MINTGTTGHNSVIKFGSWDETSVKDGNLKQLKTIDSSEWTLWADQVSLNNEDFLDEKNKIDLSPHLPYMYVPDDAWSQFAVGIDRIYDEIDCSWDKGYCRFTTSCANLDKDSKSVPLSIDLIDQDNTKMSISADLRHLFLSGTEFDVGEDFCYVPVFRSFQEDDTWFVGSLFL